MLFTLTGASGTGKTTIIRRVMAEKPNAKVMRSVTTRAQRDTDLPGEYLYVDNARFDAFSERGEFAWKADFSKARYGTLKSDIREALASDDPYLAAIVPDTIKDVHDFAAKNGLKTRVRSIFIFSPPADVLRRRMLVERGEPSEDVERKIRDCATWDARGKSDPHCSDLIEDRDDFEKKIRAVLNLLDRPR